ncbi:MAG: RNA polymerase sigma factor [Myxococcales bacterium]|nr:RNA polymerase sigma factor [Myxococcales bacterium]MDD9971249.1 RNA polymerase sigma factor [Myxococcales bacterium]
MSKTIGIRMDWRTPPATSKTSTHGAGERAGLDDRAIRELYREHHEDLRGFARRLLGDHQAAEDLVQDVFVALPRALERFRGDSSVRTLLRAIALNHARHHVRAAARRRKAMARYAAEEANRDRASPSEIRRRELADRLSRALDALPLKQRAAFVLCEVEGMSAPQAADVIGVPAPTVRTRLHHARRKLRALLEEAP